MSDFLRPQQFAAFLSLSERQARNVTAQLEALGFKLTPAPDGVRLVPGGLAAAVKESRQAKRELASLRLDPALMRYLSRGAGEGLDTFDLLLHLATEVSIAREVVAVMGGAMAVGATAIKQFSWRNHALDDPRIGL